MLIQTNYFGIQINSKEVGVPNDEKAIFIYSHGVEEIDV